MEKKSVFNKIRFKTNKVEQKIPRVELKKLFESLSEFCEQIVNTMELATESLHKVDAKLAEKVIDQQSNHAIAVDDAKQVTFSILAPQNLELSDLRTIMSAFQIIDDLNRMSALTIHVAKTVRLRYPNYAINEALADNFKSMGSTAIKLGYIAAHILRTGDLELSQSLRTEDDTIDNLNREIYSMISSPQISGTSIESVNAALLARYYERFSDHAVTIGNQVIFIHTGEIN